MSSPTITILYNTTIYVVKFRMRLIKNLQDAGYKVVVIAPVDESVKYLNEAGVEHRHVEMSQYGMNPISELITILNIYKILKEIGPKVSLHYTVKPNIFGTIAARLAGVPVINNVAGAGRVFTSGNQFFRKFISYLYRLAFSHSSVVFFQNNDDMKSFLSYKILRVDKAVRIPGSGVDLKNFTYSLDTSDQTRFLFIGRLLKEKGIGEYLSAAEKIKKTYPDVQFDIVGEHEESNLYLSSERLKKATSHKIVRYLGALSPDKIQQTIKDSSCVVLPSYYGEGVPRVLLEASACGRPIITTDNVGCRDVVEDKANGFMVPPRDHSALAGAIQSFVKLSSSNRKTMGVNARYKIEREFDEKIVLNTYLAHIEEINPRN